MFALREVRESRGMQQKEVAKAMGITPQRLSNWEHGTREINLRDACLLADVLDCTLDELAGRQWPRQRTSDPPMAASSGELSRADLTPGERGLLDAYRATDDRGRATIDAIAESQRGDEAEAEAEAYVA